jgi:hypothetical protein
MKKIGERIKDIWCRVLPVLLLVGIPTAIGIVIWIISNWNDFPEIANHISTVGSGSLLYGVIILLFALIGLINAFAAFMMWMQYFLELLNKKVKSHVGFWLPIIIVTFGWYALFKLIKLL